MSSASEIIFKVNESKKTGLTTTLLVPTLNEIQGMREIMPRVNKEWVDEIVLIDGGSTDGTLDYAKEQGYRILHQKSRGISKAYEEAMPHIQNDIVIAFSPDGNSIPELIPQLISKMNEGYDMVIASRYLGKAKSADDDRVTAFGNWLFTTAINIVFGAHYTDSLVILRAYKKDVVKQFPKHMPPRAGMEPLLSIRCAKQKMKSTEIPGDEPKRIGGERKMSPLLNGLDILRLIFQERFGID
jgi:glycosyltransferase involved in cell wall biosynthesis